MVVLQIHAVLNIRPRSEIMVINNQYFLIWEKLSWGIYNGRFVVCGSGGVQIISLAIMVFYCVRKVNDGDGEIKELH